MEKKYVTPEMEITEFDVEDIITTSGKNDTETPIEWIEPTTTTTN